MALTFVLWTLAGSLAFGLLYWLGGRLGISQQYSPHWVVIPGGVLCGAAAALLQSPCGVLPPVLYAGMLCAEKYG